MNHQSTSWSQRRWVWLATLLAAYLLGSLIWSGATLIPRAIPQTLYYAPTGLIRLTGIPVYIIPDARPPEIEKILPIIHFIFWPVLILLLVFLKRLPGISTTVLYFLFAALLLTNLGGCLFVAGL